MLEQSYLSKNLITLNNKKLPANEIMLRWSMLKRKTDSATCDRMEEKSVPALGAMRIIAVTLW